VSDSIPALSVVIPLYNKRATVLRSVDSVVSQLRNGDEVIIVTTEVRMVGLMWSNKGTRAYRSSN